MTAHFRRHPAHAWVMSAGLITVVIVLDIARVDSAEPHLGHQIWLRSVLIAAALGIGLTVPLALLVLRHWPGSRRPASRGLGVAAAASGATAIFAFISTHSRFHVDQTLSSCWLLGAAVSSDTFVALGFLALTPAFVKGVRLRMLREDSPPPSH